MPGHYRNPQIRKQISIYLPNSDWRALRDEASRRRISLAELCRRRLQPDVDRLRQAPRDGWSGRAVRPRRAKGTASTPECRTSLQWFRAAERPAGGSFGRPRSRTADTLSRQPETSSPPPARLTDAEWAAIAPLLPSPSRHGRPRRTDQQAVVAAIRHHWHTGTPWRNLPPGFPPWPTVYRYFRQWGKDGTLRRLRMVLGAAAAFGADRRPSSMPPHGQGHQDRWQRDDPSNRR